MSKSIIIDVGHGGTDTGAIGFGVREKDWNLRISLYQYERLKELGAKVGITRTTDKALDATPRTNLIKNKYDLCISNHWNAFNGSARGIETIHSIFGGKDFATSIANALVKVTGLPLRRVFSLKNSSGGDYYFMHRLTGGTRTVIIEYGFLDNITDHNWYKTEANFYKAAEAVIEAICKEIGITYKSKGNASKPKPTEKVITGRLFKVQAGAFKEIKNAENLHERMERAGIDAFVVQENGLYKVQAGAYSVKDNAEAQLKKVTKLVGDGFIIETGTAGATPKPAPKPTPQPKRGVRVGDAVTVPAGKLYEQGNAVNSSNNAKLTGKVERINDNWRNSMRLINSKGQYIGFARMSDIGAGAVSSGKHFDANVIAQQIRKGIDNKGKNIPTGHEPRRKYFGLTEAEYDKVRARVNQIM